MIKTQRLTRDDADKAAEILRGGGIVAIPTDTVYGLAAVPELEKAVERIYRVKGRDSGKALILLISDPDVMERICCTVPDAYRLAQEFWPGALTVILKKKRSVPDSVTSGGDTVGVRCPDSPVARNIIRLAGGAVAAPSANISGESPPTSAGEVLEQLDGLIDAVVDAGTCECGIPSTIVDLTGNRPEILRQGAVTAEQIFRALGENKTVRLGVTGPTGAGKTTALKALEQMGALAVDCDKVYHSLLEEDDELKAALNERFAGILRSGRIDTKELGRIVFADKAALEDLNRITGRFVVRRIDRMEKEYLARGGSIIAYDAIRLLEGYLRNRCDAVIGIIAPKDVREKRIMKREGISREYAAMRIAAQPDEAYYAERCDVVIESNKENPEEFRAECARRFESLIADIRSGGFKPGKR
jgi:tRNA threonylcarbamoyl adenosine modification protein (Sua5/YciO/YrdC/YwlC family)/dephospho-CoA kinase